MKTKINNLHSFLFVSAAIIFFTVLSCSQQKVGINAKPPSGAELLFDGSREMLDEKWTYWEGPRFSAELPISWEIVEDPVDEGTAVSAGDRAAEGGKYGAAECGTSCGRLSVPTRPFRRLRT